MTKPNERDPREYPWGVYAHDDIPGLGNTGVFDWHVSKEDSADHLQWLADQYVEGAGWDSDKKVVARRILGEVRSGDLRVAEAIDRFNHEFENLVQIDWWGRFEDLVSGDEEFPRRVRERIRVGSFNEEEFDPSPIPDHEVDDFISAVQGYGY